MALLTYVPSQVSVTIAGLFDIEGFADGTFIEIVKEVAPYQAQVGMDGQVSRTFTFDATYTVTLTLAQTSKSNNLLNRLHAIDLATQLGKVPFFLRDKEGSTTFFSPTAWIENQPRVSFSKDMETRIWSLRCTDGVLVVGGSGDTKLLDTALGLLPGVSNLLGGI